MIANALLLLLEHPSPLAGAKRDPARLDAAIEESLRLEPAAAVSTATPRPTRDIAGADIDQGDLVRVSITAANRDPAVFPDPDRLRPGPAAPPPAISPSPSGPHVCVGVHLARLEARTALAPCCAG